MPLVLFNPKILPYQVLPLRIRVVGSLVVRVLWFINLCRLFNAKFCLYVYTFNQRFLNEYSAGKIFYGQDFIGLHMINQF